MRRTLALAALMLWFGLSAAVAQTSPPEGVIVITPDKVPWADAPDMGKGVQQAVLMGDPTKPGPFVIRLKLPAGLTVPAHTHPNVENVVIISGVFSVGLGEKADRSKAQEFGPGTFVSLPANTPHYGWTDKEEVVLQIHGEGPTGMTLVKQEASK